MVDAIKVWTAVRGWGEIAMSTGDRSRSRSDDRAERRHRPRADCRDLAEQAKRASRQLAVARGAAKDAWLTRSADGAASRGATRSSRPTPRDVAAAPGARAERRGDRPPDAQPEADRRDGPQPRARSPPCPTRSARSSRRAGGPTAWTSRQVRVPLGVIFMIYESRPNVTVDAAALCVKSGNAAILRGGKEAIHSNRALHRVLADELAAVRPARPTPSSSSRRPTARPSATCSACPTCIDLAIPRGGEGLIRRVAAEAEMPVLKHYHGQLPRLRRRRRRPRRWPSGSSSTPRPSARASATPPRPCSSTATSPRRFLPARRRRPRPRRASSSAATTRAARPRPGHDARPTPSDWDTEFLDLILAVGVVDSLDEAIAHIARHGSGHTEAIVTRDLAAARRFVAEVDSSAVMVNASTRFNDGGQLGLGAEIGISTDKFHARGPCGLRELTSTKWIVYGDGQIRE